jgi:hypothetical protein
VLLAKVMQCTDRALQLRVLVELERALCSDAVNLDVSMLSQRARVVCR